MGAMGFMGSSMVVDCHIEVGYCHTGGMPMSVHMFCLSSRRATARVTLDGRAEFRATRNGSPTTCAEPASNGRSPPMPAQPNDGVERRRRWRGVQPTARARFVAPGRLRGGRVRPVCQACCRRVFAKLAAGAAAAP